MKVLQHIIIICSFIAATAKTLSSYLTGADYLWPLIASMWILSCYLNFTLNTFLEKKLKQYEG